MEVIHPELDQSPLPFLHLMQNLKTTPRTGWLRTIQNPESVADHSFRLALLAMFAPDGVNKDRCIFLALCHDMAESVIGDIPTYADHKYKLEDSGFQFIQSLLKSVDSTLGEKIRDAWLEYEEGKSKEAQWVRDMDKFECMIQAHEYEQKTYGEKDLEEFQGLSSKIGSLKGKEWLTLLQQERKDHFAKRKNLAPVIFLIGPSTDGSKTQYSSMSPHFHFQHIYLDDLFRERADDQTYLHAQFLKDCLLENISLPTELVISLLENKIREGTEKGKKWSIVHGFPNNMREILAFEEKVQRINYTLFIKRSGKELQREVTPSRVSSRMEDEPDFAKMIRSFEGTTIDVENHLKATGYFKEIDGDRTRQAFNDLVMEAAVDLVNNAEESH